MWMGPYLRRRLGRSLFSCPAVSRWRLNLGRKMAPSRPALTPLRRAVGVAVVAFLISGAVVFYQLAPGFPTSGPSPSTATNSSASPAPTRVSTETVTPTGGSSSSASGEAKAIQLEDSTVSAKPFQAVRIQGTYHGGADTFLWVQRWEGGTWVAFPVPTKTDQSGQFTAYVELGQPGRYRLRVLDPETGLKSTPFVLVITR
jgi:hypothetical protein